nr:integrase, catalytic region, zinc finger, CCHC-type, peptidase aspartic, catalytic [Tanacetum cinerariifolium]
MALVLMAKAFKLNYSTPTNNNQRISSNPHNRQIAQPGMNMDQDRQMQMVGGNVQNVVNQVVQNLSVQNGLIVVLRITNQNSNGNGNVVAALAEGNAIRNNVDFNEIKKVNANCILMANLQQASTSGTKTDKALVYDLDRSAENDSNVNFEVSSVEQDGGTVDQHPTTVEETRVDNTVKTRMPQPRSNTKNDKVPSASKSSCNKNKKVENNKSEVICAMCKQCLINANHDICVVNYVNDMNSHDKKLKANVSNTVTQKKQMSKVRMPKKVGSNERLASPKPSKHRYCLRWSPTERLFDLKGKIIASGESESQSDCSNGDNACNSNLPEPTIKRNLKLLINFVWMFLGTVRFGNDHVAAIIDFGDLQWGNILVTRVYFVEGSGHNLFSVGQFCDSDLEVALRKNTCFVKNLEEVTPSSYGFVWSNENRKHKWKAFKTWASKYDFWIDQFSLDLTYTPSTIATQQPTEGKLDLLFEAMYDDYIGGQRSATSRTALDTQAPQVRHTLTVTTITADTTPTPTNSSSQAINFPNTSQDVDELKTQQHVQRQPATIIDNVPNAMFNENTFVNPFATPSTSATESSYSQYVDPSNMHTFYQPYPYEYQWTKDNPLEQVIGEPSRLVLTRNQL